jgi:UDP-N-acetyl-D-glucosamine dehydrogenase
MIISVVGMGKIGLPLAVQYASQGHTVMGVDISQKTVDLVNAGEEPFPGEAGLAEALPELTQKGLLTATTSYESAIPQSDAVVVVVPLFVDANDQPDFGWMDSATKSMGTNLTANTLVIYETTLPIGTTRNRWKPMLEHESGLQEGQDFHLVFSPERVLTGRVFEDLRKYPKLVGGLSPAGAEKAVEFYHSVLEFDPREDLAEGNGVWDLGSAEAAEMAKLAETTYRDVNIALANQFALHAEEIGVDVHKVIAACNSQPYSHVHEPGIWVGGHCIPVYPRLYLSSDRNAELVAVARKINTSMKFWAIRAIENLLMAEEKAVILILGISYRSGVKEIHESGAIELLKELSQRGHKVIGYDPLFDQHELKSIGFDTETNIKEVSIVICQNKEETFSHLGVTDFPNVRMALDGRQCLQKGNWGTAQFHRLGAGSTIEL